MRSLLCVGLTVAMSVALVTAAEAQSATAKGKGKGKIHVCVAKKGADKGAMRWVRGKKCHKGEKAMSWNKKGKPGPAGQAGPAGAPGGASQDTIDQLRAQLDAQAARITSLETQVGQLTGQLTALTTQLGALSGQFSSFQTLACDQLGALTDQSNALGTAIDGIDLTGVLGGLVFTNPGAPTSLPGFSC